LNVSAKDLGTGNEQKITITGSSNLDRGEIDRMVTEAEANRERDEKLQQLAMVKNEADRLVSSMERILREQGDKVDEGDRSRIEEAIENVKRVREQDDLDSLQAAVKELESLSHTLTEKMYNQASAGQEAGVGAATGGASDDVIDAEFSEDNKSQS